MPPARPASSGGERPSPLQSPSSARPSRSSASPSTSSSRRSARCLRSRGPRRPSPAIGWRMPSTASRSPGPELQELQLFSCRRPAGERSGDSRRRAGGRRARRRTAPARGRGAPRLVDQVPGSLVFRSPSSSAPMAPADPGGPRPAHRRGAGGGGVPPVVQRARLPGWRARSHLGGPAGVRAGATRFEGRTGCDRCGVSLPRPGARRTAYEAAPPAFSDAERRARGSPRATASRVARRAACGRRPRRSGRGRRRRDRRSAARTAAA